MSSREKWAIILGLAGVGGLALWASLKGGTKTTSMTYVGNGASPNVVPVPFKPLVLTVEFGGVLSLGGGHAIIHLSDQGIEGIQVGGAGSASGLQKTANVSNFYSNGQLDIGALQSFFESVQTPTPFDLNQAGKSYSMSVIG